jgi:hypothetical protein
MSDEVNAMDLVFGKNPTRPNHPDLWRISQVLLHNDAAVDEAAPDDKDDVWKSITGTLVDVPTVLFMAEQRVRRAFGPMTSLDEIPVRARLTALVVDAFIAGAGYQKAGGHREDSTEEL